MSRSRMCVMGVALTIGVVASSNSARAQRMEANAPRPTRAVHTPDSSLKRAQAAGEQAGRARHAKSGAVLGAIIGASTGAIAAGHAGTAKPGEMLLGGIVVGGSGGAAMGALVGWAWPVRRRPTGS